MDLLVGLSQVAAWPNLLAIIVGTAIGLAFGLTPGLDATTGTALFLAFTFALPGDTGVLLLLALYMSATYAGSITAICLGVPGTPSSAAALIDGYPMTKRGESGRALGIALFASVLGGLVGTIALLTLTEPLARVAVQLGSAEYFALVVFALTMVANLVGNNWLTGLLGVVFGVLLTSIGLDAFTGAAVFTFGVPELYEGLPYVPALIGLFAISEALHMAATSKESVAPRSDVKGGLRAGVPRRSDLRQMGRALGIGSIGGAFIGVLPGIGGAAGNWMTYNEAKRFSRTPDEFGRGSPEGLAAAESGNNATVSAALIPLLALGIPGSATAAVLLGGLVVHGVVPGPRLIEENGALVSLIVAGLFISVIAMFVLGATAIQGWVRLLQIPKVYIIAVILVMSVIGAYAMRSSMFDIYIVLIFGALGYLLRKAGISIIPIVIGLVLGGLLESHFRRAVIADPDGFATFLQSPFALLLLSLSVLSVGFSMLRGMRSGKKVLSAREG